MASLARPGARRVRIARLVGRAGIIAGQGFWAEATVPATGRTACRRSAAAVAEFMRRSSGLRSEALKLPPAHIARARAPIRSTIHGALPPSARGKPALAFWHANFHQNGVHELPRGALDRTHGCAQGGQASSRYARSWQLLGKDIPQMAGCAMVSRYHPALLRTTRAAVAQASAAGPQHRSVRHDAPWRLSIPTTKEVVVLPVDPLPFLSVAASRLADRRGVAPRSGGPSGMDG